MAIFNKQHFHTGVTGPGGVLFRTGNLPQSSVFSDLFESVLFKLNAEDSATLFQSGHSRIEQDTRAMARSTFINDGWTRFIQAHHLPNLYLQQLPQHQIISAQQFGDLEIKELQYSYPTNENRKDFLIRSLMNFVSSDNSITIVPVGNGQYDFQLNSLLATDSFKVKLHSTDNPDFLGNKLSPNLHVNLNNLLDIRHSDTHSINLESSVLGLIGHVKRQNTNSIILDIDANGLYANLKVADPSMSITSAGVKVTKPCNNIKSSSATLKTFYDTRRSEWDINLDPLMIKNSMGIDTDVQFSDGIGGFVNAERVIHLPFTVQGEGLYYGLLNRNTAFMQRGSLAIGNMISAVGMNSVGIGQFHHTIANNSLAIGTATQVDNWDNSICVGYANNESERGKYQFGEIPLRKNISGIVYENLYFSNQPTGQLFLLQDTITKIELNVIVTSEIGVNIYNKIDFTVSVNNNGVMSINLIPPLRNISDIIPDMIIGDFLSNLSIIVNTNNTLSIQGRNGTEINAIWSATIRFLTSHLVSG